jgi:hypothetical protein
MSNRTGLVPKLWAAGERMTRDLRKTRHADDWSAGQCPARFGKNGFSVRAMPVVPVLQKSQEMFLCQYDLAAKD